MPHARGGSGPSPNSVFSRVPGAAILLAGALFAPGAGPVAVLAPVATAIAAAFGAALAYAAVWWNRRMARPKAVLDVIGASESKEACQERYRACRAYRPAHVDAGQDIADQGHPNHDGLRAKCQDFLNHHERVALACRQGLIDEAITRAWMGPAFLRDWAEAGGRVAQARRAAPPDDVGKAHACVEFERLARRCGVTTPPPPRAR